MFEDGVPRGIAERLLSLRSFSLLSALPASELALVARLSRERDFQTGEVLATMGQQVQAVLLVISGRAAVSLDGIAQEDVGAFQTVGLLPLAAGLPHQVTSVAVEPVHALEIDADLVDEVLEDDFGLFVRVLGAAAGAARRASGAGGDPREGGGSECLGSSGAADMAGEAPPLAELRGPWGAARRLLLLRETRLFRTAPVDGLAAFAKRMELVRLARGEQLQLRGGASGELALVVGGAAEITPVNPSGQFQATAAPLTRTSLGTRAGRGELVGAREALSQTSPPVGLRALTETHLLRGAASDLLDVMEDHHAMGRSLMAELLSIHARP